MGLPRFATIDQAPVPEMAEDAVKYLGIRQCLLRDCRGLVSVSIAKPAVVQVDGICLLSDCSRETFAVLEDDGLCSDSRSGIQRGC